ncbi:hypothetical protein [Streptomyces sp. NPDC002785]|uniref:LexA family protein n=1 Tax=Streptomyces sp. NPDC002785 TaxID=3154543 RepID=UPI00332FF1E4
MSQTQRTWSAPVAERGEAPTIREIGRSVGLSSPASVAYHLGQTDSLGSSVSPGGVVPGGVSVCIRNGCPREPRSARRSLRPRGAIVAVNRMYFLSSASRCVTPVEPGGTSDAP